MKKLTNEEFLQKLKDKNIPYTPLEEYKDAHNKMKWMCYKNPMHIFDANYCNISHGRGCPYCSGHKVFVGETDLWTTHPEIAKMLKNPEDGYKYSYGSCEKVDWICSNCGSIVKDKFIYDVVWQGLSCPMCSDGVSYPNKFMLSVLRQIQVECVPEYKFNGSKYKYDFYIPLTKTIIEMHGGQHYEDCNNFYKTFQEIHKNDIEKYNFAINNGIENYIVVDSKKSNIDYISQNILSSPMSDLFNLNNIDWQECGKYASGSLVKICAEMYNNKKTIEEISSILKYSKVSVRNWLKMATESGLCNYIPSKKLLREKKSVICLETNRIYGSVNSTKKDGFDPSQVSACCHGDQKTHRSLHWMFYEDYLKENSEDNYGKAI